MIIGSYQLIKDLHSIKRSGVIRKMVLIECMLCGDRLEYVKNDFVNNKKKWCRECNSWQHYNGWRKKNEQIK